jgi:hypothetical protein
MMARQCGRSSRRAPLCRSGATPFDVISCLAEADRMSLGVAASGAGQDGAGSPSLFRGALVGLRAFNYLAASTSAESISGGSANRSSAFFMSRAAIGPPMCACRPSSLANVSKIQKVVSEVLAAYQATVPASAWAKRQRAGQQLSHGRGCFWFGLEADDKRVWGAHLLPPAFEDCPARTLGISGAIARPLADVAPVARAVLCWCVIRGS